MLRKPNSRIAVLLATISVLFGGAAGDFAMSALSAAETVYAEPAPPTGRASQAVVELGNGTIIRVAKRVAVNVDPDRQVLVLIGSKEGLAHLPLAHLENGDRALVPDLGYPVYERSVILAGGRPSATGPSGRFAGRFS